MAALRVGLRDLGWVEGRNIVIEFRWAEGNYQRLPALAEELVGLNVDVLVTHGAADALAAKNATSTVPIVITAVGDMVALGLVSSLSRPGGNITGSSLFVAEHTAKRLARRRQMWNCGHSRLVNRATSRASSRPFADQQIGALVVHEDTMLNANANALAVFAAARRLPSCGFPEFVRSGGLLAYGINFADLDYRAAAFIDKILKGAKPGDLPVERN